MKETKQGKFSMTILLLIFGLVPMFCVGVSIFEIARKSMENEVSTSVHAQLDASNHQFNLYIQDSFADELGSDTWEKDYTYVDSLLNSNIVMTVFLGDTRVLTSIKDNNGQRLEGTQASEEVIEAVLNKGMHFTSENVQINGETYYVDYLPLKNSAGQIVGMSFVGEKASIVTNASKKMIVRLLTISLIVAAVVVALILAMAKVVKGPIMGMVDSLKVIAQGHIYEEFNLKSAISEYKSIISSLDVLQGSLTNAVDTIKTSSHYGDYDKCGGTD